MIPALLGFGLILTTKGPMTSQRLSVGFFLAGFTGIILIVQRESLIAVISVHGKWAMWQGIIFTAACWSIAFYFWIFSL